MGDRLRYVNQLSNDEIIEMIVRILSKRAKVTLNGRKIYTTGLRELMQITADIYYIDGDEEEQSIVNETLNMDDFTIRCLYCNEDNREATRRYREWMSSKFGQQYSVDFLMK